MEAHDYYSRNQKHLACTSDRDNGMMYFCRLLVLVVVGHQTSMIKSVCGQQYTCITNPIYARVLHAG